MEIANGCLEVFAALVIFILFISVPHEKAVGTIERHLTAMVVCHMVVLVLDAARWFLYQYEGPQALLVTLSVLPTVLALAGNAVFARFAIIFLSQNGPIPRKAVNLSALPFVFAVAVWGVLVLTNGLGSAANMQTNYSEMQHSWGYWLGHLGWASMCVIGLTFIWKCRSGLKSKELLSLSSYCAFPLVALVLRFFWDGPQIFLSTALSLIWIYAVVQRARYLRLQEQENQLVQSGIAILLSQIQPHFLYNTLTIICGLCDENPKEAKAVTADFADYLRHNLDTLTQNTPVPLSKELQHTQLYLNIEKKRFGQRLQVVYDIGVRDFLLPSLTVQPMVENAVKHGVLKRKAGGTVTISTRNVGTCYEITVEDNGIGFNPAAPLPEGKVHIGTQNVRERLWSMCGGTLTVESEIGKGTRAIIRIPKRGD